jgi:hypothetical protein
MDVSLFIGAQLVRLALLRCVRADGVARRLLVENEPAKKRARVTVIHRRSDAIRRRVIEQVDRCELADGWTEVALCGPAASLSHH